MPYIGARPYVFAGSSLDWATVCRLRCFCAPIAPRIDPENEEIAVWVIVCWIDAILFAEIVFAYTPAFVALPLDIPTSVNSVLVKKSVCFIWSLFLFPWIYVYYSTKILLLKIINQGAGGCEFMLRVLF